MDADVLMDSLIELTEKKVGHIMPVKKLVDRIGGDDMDKRIRFLVVFKDCVRDIPIEAFLDDKNKKNLMEGVQKVLDEEIRKEDEEEEFVDEL